MDGISLKSIGKNGPMVSPFGLGTMTFGAETDEAEAYKQLDYFVEFGGNFIDTADAYSDGMSEEIIGRWRRSRGGVDDLIIATKCRFAPPLGSHGGSRRAITRSLEASLRRLQMECIDIYLLHGWDKDTEVFETLSTLDDQIRAGKIHNIAWSNVTGWQLQKIISTAEQIGMNIPVAVQPQYNLLERGIELELLPCCLENGIGITPWSPLGGGWLTGKYSGDERPYGATRLGEDPNRGVEAYDRRNNEQTFEILEVMRAISDRVERPLSHIAISWLNSRPSVRSILLGARTTEQLADNLEGFDVVLEPEDLAALTKISVKGLPEYPYQFVANWSGMEIWKQLGAQ